MCNINLSVLLSPSPDQGRLGPNPLLRAYIIPSSGHWTNLSILTFWHVAPSGGQKTHSAALRATEPALFTVTLKTPLDYLLFFLKTSPQQSDSVQLLGPAPWEDLYKTVWHCLMKVCVAATMKTQTGEEKSSNHRHRLDTFTQSCSFRLIPPPPPLEANTQVLHHTVCSFLSCIVQLFLLCGLRAGFFLLLLFIPHGCLLS